MQTQAIEWWLHCQIAIAKVRKRSWVNHEAFPTRLHCLQTPKKHFNPTPTQNVHRPSQLRRQTRHRDSAEPAYLTSLSPGERYPSLAPSTTQNVVDHTKFLRRQNRQGANTKPTNVLSTVLLPTHLLECSSPRTRPNQILSYYMHVNSHRAPRYLQPAR